VYHLAGGGREESNSNLQQIISNYAVDNIRNSSIFYIVQLGPSPKLKLAGGPKHNTKFGLSHPPTTTQHKLFYQTKTSQDKPRQAKTSQEEPRQGKPRQAKTSQDKPRQAKTSQDKPIQAKTQAKTS
jgi:hypothetical protein